MQQFSRARPLSSLCAASTARQSEHQTLQDVSAVFLDLDRDNDGFLEMKDIRAGFEKAYGSDSGELQNVDATFASADLNQSGKIGYSEFCAAAIGEDACLQDRALWLAFSGLNTQEGDRLLPLHSPMHFAAFKALVRGGSDAPPIQAVKDASGFPVKMLQDFCFACISKISLRSVGESASHLFALAPELALICSPNQ